MVSTYLGVSDEVNLKLSTSSMLSKVSSEMSHHALLNFDHMTSKAMSTSSGPIYSLMAYSRPQSIHTHLNINKSLQWVLMKEHSMTHKHVKLLL